MKIFTTLLFSLIFLLATSSIATGQIVTTGIDDGSPGALRQVIANAAAGSEVIFATAVVAVELNAEIVIDKTITISGLPGLNLIIDGNNTGRIFNILGGEVVLNNLTLRNGIAANGTSGQDVSGMYTSNDYNLVASDDANAFTPAPNDQEGVAPNIGPLEDNGGFTDTHALRQGSPGVDGGDPTDTFNDQRDSSIVGRRDIGAYESEGVVGIQEIAQIVNSSVYPNPTRGQVTIDVIETIKGQISLQVIAVTGQIVQKSTLNPGTNNLDMSQLAPGMYQLQVSSAEGFSTLKLLINK
jgi:hypothetical protein